MIDLGWSELLVIGVVALIVVGPKDLPLLFRRLGEFTGRMRAMAREFSSAMDRAADEAGMSDVQKDLRSLRDPRRTGLDAINEAARDLADIDGDKVAPAPRPAARKTAETAPDPAAPSVKRASADGDKAT